MAVLIGIVGPCGAGKTTLANNLKALQINARAIAQEHSYVPNMWQALTHPDILIFLDASYPVTMQRRNMRWTYREYEEQHHRLRHAREHTNLFIFTDPLTPEGVTQLVVNF
ncbi:MAG: hypothetical protein ABFD44_02615, partial [Anaerolineaceae bacterium]